MDTIFSNENPTLSIIALCISVISVITSLTVSVISIKKQETYSRINVKPFCTVYEANYDNFIYVGIKNDGLGPLILKELSFASDNGFTSNSLLDLLPTNIKHMTYHRIYIGWLRQRALCVGEKLPLLSITPKDPSIGQEFRDLLKTITVTVKYTSTYGKGGQTIKKLNLFKTALNVSITDEGRRMFF